mmetsp:Transcript_3559/g.11904  ORF Transcript_3559/g.11904 Transcript_3559/m.11904 type:complete len:220 (-) Transcript_3559:612-1271(-)
MTQSAAMTPRASVKLWGILIVAKAAHIKPNAYLTLMNFVTACSCIRSIDGLNNTPSVSNTSGLFALASGTTSCAAVFGSAMPIKFIKLARDTAITGGNVATFSNNALAVKLLASAAFLAVACAAFVAAIVPSQSFTVVASTNSLFSHNPAFTAPVRSTRIPVPSNAPRLSSPAYDPPLPNVYTPKPSLTLFFHCPSYVDPDGYRYTPYPCFFLSSHSPS